MNWRISLNPKKIIKSIEEHEETVQKTDVENKIEDKLKTKLDTVKTRPRKKLNADLLKEVKQKVDINQVSIDLTDIKKTKGKMMEDKIKTMFIKSSNTELLKTVKQEVIKKADNKKVVDIVKTKKAETSLTELLKIANRDLDANRISSDIKAMEKIKIKYLVLTMAKHLAVFDFDHTIINDNSDIMVMNMVDKKYIPKEVKDLHKSDGWTVFMQKVFGILYQNNVQEDSINKLMKNLPAVAGMIKLIKELNLNHNYDVIVISDSNSHFIHTWLGANDLSNNIFEVFTNPAKFENGMLKIQMYHLQDSCKLSTKNLCKGQVLDEFLEKQKMKDIHYETIIYCGDGLHDFCPILKLNENDIACVRDKYKLLDLVKKAQKGQYFDENGIMKNLKCDVCVWNTGHDILDFLKQKNKNFV